MMDLRWIIIWIVIIFGLLIALTGCTQRVVSFYEYDEVNQIHKEWSYKLNNLASRQEIDWLCIDMPGKGKLWFGPYVMDNDSFKGGYGPFWMGTSDGN